MRYRLILLLLLVLPFQLSWAAVAGYCQHESEISAHHPGHHEHKHQADAGNASHAGVPDTSPAGSVDNDCGTCHAGCGMAPFTTAEMALTRRVSLAIPWCPAIHSSPPNAQPERPNWSRLA
jgi:hypothetical protein